MMFSDAGALEHEPTTSECTPDAPWLRCRTGRPRGFELRPARPHEAVDLLMYMPVPRNDGPRAARPIPRYLPTADGLERVALAVTEPTPDGEDAPVVGLGWWIREPGSPGAELSMIVASDRRRKGVGHMLLTALLDSARDRGVQWIHIRPRTNEDAWVSLAASVSSQLIVHRHGGETVIEIPIF